MNKGSVIKKIIYTGSRYVLGNDIFGLSMEPVFYNYSPIKMEEFPWLNKNSRTMPIFSLSNEEKCIGTENEWATRDCIHIDSSIYGTYRFAELLLNAGCASNDQLKFTLEGEVGFQGVGPGSAEMRINIEGSSGYTNWYKE